MSNLTDLKAAIDQDRDNYARYLVYADCLEENGFDDLAFAWRWMGKSHKQPFYRDGARVKKRWAWNWSYRTAVGRVAVINSFLPHALVLVVAKYPGIAEVIYDTEDEAVLALAEGLKKLREALN